MSDSSSSIEERRKAFYQAKLEEAQPGRPENYELFMFTNEESAIGVNVHAVALTSNKEKGLQVIISIDDRCESLTQVDGSLKEAMGLLRKNPYFNGKETHGKVTFNPKARVKADALARYFKSISPFPGLNIIEVDYVEFSSSPHRDVETIRLKEAFDELEKGCPNLTYLKLRMIHGTVEAGFNLYWFALAYPKADLDVRLIDVHQFTKGHDVTSLVFENETILPFNPMDSWPVKKEEPIPSAWQLFKPEFLERLEKFKTVRKFITIRPYQFVPFDYRMLQSIIIFMLRCYSEWCWAGEVGAGACDQATASLSLSIAKKFDKALNNFYKDVPTTGELTKSARKRVRDEEEDD